MNALKISLLAVVLISTALFAHASEPQKWSPDQNAFKTVDGTINELYRAVTFKANAVPDWQKVIDTFFIPETVIVLRTARDKMSVVSREGFALLFIADVKKHKLDQTGFQEKLISKKIKEFGHIARCTAVYEVSVPGRGFKMRGVDFFNLMKKDGRWWIVSIVNDVPMQGKSIPEEFLK